MFTPVNETICEQVVNDYINQIQMEATDITYLRSLQGKPNARERSNFSCKNWFRNN